MKFAGSLTDSDSREAAYEIIGVPFDGNALRKGAGRAPYAIRRASQQLETFLWRDKLELSDLLYHDRGDIHSFESLYHHFNSDFGFDFDFEFEFETGERGEKRKIFIGGDHSISYPLFRYYFTRHELTKVVVIDAHADFRDVYMNNRFSNACVMRRIAELAGFENVIEIGVRSASREEYEYMADKGVRVYDATGLPEPEVLEGKLYLSIDIDVLDPGIAPGVEHPEPCGITLDALIALTRGIIMSEGVDMVACDIVEVNPLQDVRNGITAINAARLIFEILASLWLKDSSRARA